MSLPLSKCLDPKDFDLLTDELKIVDEHFTKAREQHSMRRWEYAMALRAYRALPKTPQRELIKFYDVGGAGSPFEHMVHDFRGCRIWPTVIDPDHNEWGQTLEQYMTGTCSLGEAVFCLSVIEHVDDLQRFLYHLCCLTAPGGLLFLTADYRGDEGPDDKHFHWMRKRIFTPATWANQVLLPILKRDFSLLGGRDDPSQYPGDFVYDYSFVSAAFVKRP